MNVVYIFYVLIMVFVLIWMDYIIVIVLWVGKEIIVKKVINL